MYGVNMAFRSLKMRKRNPAISMMARRKTAMMPQSGMLHLLFRNLSFGLVSRPTILKVSLWRSERPGIFERSGMPLLPNIADRSGIPPAPPMPAIPANGLSACWFLVAGLDGLGLLLFLEETTSTSASMVFGSFLLMMWLGAAGLA
jgi:hypothetical protein